MCASVVSRVLIVEDDETVRGFLTRALESGGFVPIAVRTAEEALDIVRTEPPAAALIDGVLPDMHGVRLAQAMLDIRGAELMAICFVTGAIRESVPSAAGVTAMSKPTRLADLLSGLQLLMRWRAQGGSPLSERRNAIHSLEQGFLVGP